MPQSASGKVICSDCMQHFTPATNQNYLMDPKFDFFKDADHFKPVQHESEIIQTTTFCGHTERVLSSYNCLLKTFHLNIITCCLL